MMIEAWFARQIIISHGGRIVAEGRPARAPVVVSTPSKSLKHSVLPVRPLFSAQGCATSSRGAAGTNGLYPQGCHIHHVDDDPRNNAH